MQSAPEKIELSEATIAALAEFPRDMFVFPAGETWPPQRPGFLDVFFRRARCGCSFSTKKGIGVYVLILHMGLEKMLWIPSCNVSSSSWSLLVLFVELEVDLCALRSLLQ